MFQEFIVRLFTRPYSIYHFWVILIRNKLLICHVWDWTPVSHVGSSLGYASFCTFWSAISNAKGPDFNHFQLSLSLSPPPLLLIDLFHISNHSSSSFYLVQKRYDLIRKVMCEAQDTKALVSGYPCCCFFIIFQVIKKISHLVTNKLLIPRALVLFPQIIQILLIKK